MKNECIHIVENTDEIIPSKLSGNEAQKVGSYEQSLVNNSISIDGEYDISTIVESEITDNKDQRENINKIELGDEDLELLVKHKCLYPIKSSECVINGSMF